MECGIQRQVSNQPFPNRVSFTKSLCLPPKASGFCHGVRIINHLQRSRNSSKESIAAGSSAKKYQPDKQCNHQQPTGPECRPSWWKTSCLKDCSWAQDSSNEHYPGRHLDHLGKFGHAMLRSSAFILFLLFANLPKKNMRSPLLYIANNYIVIIDETKAFMPCPKHNIYNSGHLEMRSLTCFELFFNRVMRIHAH